LDGIEREGEGVEIKEVSRSLMSAFSGQLIELPGEAGTLIQVLWVNSKYREV
jgi:hypothetical protein